MNLCVYIYVCIHICVYVCTCVYVCVCVCSALNEVEKPWSHGFKGSLCALAHRHCAISGKLACLGISSSCEEPELSL